jgi:hypothetical protein
MYRRKSAQASGRDGSTGDSTPGVIMVATARAVLAARGRADGPLPDLEALDHRIVLPQW